MTQYWIRIPQKLYDGLAERDAFCNDNDIDRAARAVFEAAGEQRHGRGYSRILASDDAGILDHILGYVDSLRKMVDQGVLPANELGVRGTDLAVVAQQKVAAVGGRR